MPHGGGAADGDVVAVLARGVLRVEEKDHGVGALGWVVVPAIIVVADGGAAGGLDIAIDQRGALVGAAAIGRFGRAHDGLWVLGYGLSVINLMKKLDPHGHLSSFWSSEA